MQALCAVRDFSAMAVTVPMSPSHFRCSAKFAWLSAEQFQLQIGCRDS